MYKGRLDLGWEPRAYVPCKRDQSPHSLKRCVCWTAFSYFLVKRGNTRKYLGFRKQNGFWNWIVCFNWQNFAFLIVLLSSFFYFLFFLFLFYYLLSFFFSYFWIFTYAFLLYIFLSIFFIQNWHWTYETYYHTWLLVTLITCGDLRLFYYYYFFFLFQLAHFYILFNIFSAKLALNL